MPVSRSENMRRIRSKNTVSEMIVRRLVHDEGTVRIGRRVFQGLLDQSPTPERCMEAFHLQRTRFEMIVERKLRRRQLTDDGNIEVTGRDLREKTPTVGQGSLFATVAM